MKNLPVGAELFHPDGRTHVQIDSDADMTECNSHFSKFYERT